MPLRALLACGLLAVALAARSYGLFESSIWADDVWSIAAASGHSLDVRLDGMAAGETYTDPPGPAPAVSYLEYMQPQPGNNTWRVARDAYASESHPPLFYILLHWWMQLFGYTVASGRAFSLLFSLAAIPVLFFLARRMAGETAAWIACLLCAMAPFQAQLAIQIRGYALFAFLVLVTASLTFEILEHGPNPKRVRPLILLGVTGLLTHFYFAVYAALQGLALLTQRRLLRTAVIVGVIWTAVLAAVTYYLLVQPSGLAQPWMHGPWEAPLLLLNAGAAVTDLLMLTPDESLGVFLTAYPLLIAATKLLLVAAVGGLMLAATRHLPARHLIFLLTWLGGPVILMFTLDMLRHSGTVMRARYFAGSSFALYLLLAAGLAQLKPIVRVAVTGFLLLVMLASQFALRNLPVGTLAEGYDGQRAALAISAEWRPQDLVIVLSNYGAAPVSVAYYLPPQTPILSLVYLPRAEPGPVVMPASLDGLPARLAQGVASHIWVIRCYTDLQSSEKLDAWLAGRYRAVKTQRFGSLFLREMTASPGPDSHVLRRLP
jgi:hypothetical protein